MVNQMMKLKSERLQSKSWIYKYFLGLYDQVEPLYSKQS